MRAGRRALLVAAAAMVVAGGAGAAALGVGKRPGGTATSSALPPSTATVTRGTLVDTETASGNLDHGTVTSATSRINGTLTALATVGGTVNRGQALYTVDNGPVVLMYGSLPAYRPLAEGTEGADVKQFEENLAALGYKGFTVDTKYSADTATAVRKWQKALGLPQTGIVELGRVTFATGPVRVDAHKAAVGDPAGPGQAVLTYTAVAQVVTVKLNPSQQRLAVKGRKVSVVLPDGKLAEGTIAEATTIIDPGSGNGDTAKTKIRVTVSITDQTALAGYDQATVDVKFTAQEHKDVLTVPVAALLALAEGGYGLQVVENGTTRIVRVDTDMFAGGRVEVRGDGLTAGTTVGMPS
ncbi:MAG: peptidoglycan-binding protein [Actinobacteria bacterium 13_2_20CM_2_71_6]|nr:MAG: peptidoglycan-binding protein [Actinobacteria bacterium 13_2_20CM_2_71_6]